MTHELKILPEYLNAIQRGDKTFEIRKFDRPYKVGDYLRLNGFNGKNFTGTFATKQITYILSDASEFGLMDGYVILGLR